MCNKVRDARRRFWTRLQKEYFKLLYTAMFDKHFSLGSFKILLKDLSYVMSLPSPNQLAPKSQVSLQLLLVFVGLDDLSVSVWVSSGFSSFLERKLERFLINSYPDQDKVPSEDEQMSI